MLHARKHELGRRALLWTPSASEKGEIADFLPEQERSPPLPVILQRIFRDCAMDKDRIADSAKELAGKAEGIIGDAAGDATAQVAGRARETTGAAQSLFGQAKDAARGATGAAASYANDVYDNSADTLRDSSEMLAKKVRENPLASLMIAGAVGFALALLMTPARSPSRWRYDD